MSINKIFINTHNTIFCDIHYAIEALADTSGVKVMDTVLVLLQGLVGVAEKHKITFLVLCSFLQVKKPEFHLFHVAVRGVNSGVFKGAYVFFG